MNGRSPTHERDGDRCAVTGRRSETVQHRIHGDRSYNRPSNLIAVSGSGTTGAHGWIEAHWELARAAGWTVSKHDPRDLTEIPVWLAAGPFGAGWYLLDDQWGFAAWPGSVRWQAELERLPPPAVPRLGGDGRRP